MSRIDSIRRRILAMKDAESRNNIVKAATILNTWQANQGAFLDISHITNHLQLINNWEDMVIWASECGLTGIDINLLYQECCSLSLFLRIWKVGSSIIETGSRNDAIKWFRQYKKDIDTKSEQPKKSPEDVIKELEELI